MTDDDALDDLKSKLKKRLGRYYYTLGIQLVAPTFPFPYAREIRKRADPSSKIVVDLGSGNQRVHPDVICVDSTAYDEVDLVCDIRSLPFQDGSVDAFATRSVLEHVEHPSVVAAELHRCTKPGGLGLHLIPFLFPFHASPFDFQRFTHQGIASLFRDFTLVEQRNATGPVTLLLTSLIEFLATLVSLGHQRAKSVLYLVFCGLLFPLKYLDRPFVGRKAFLTLAPTIFTVVRKNG